MKSREEQVLTNGIFPKFNMQRPFIFLLVVGALIGVGIILSFYGAQLATQNLTVREENLTPDSSIEIIADLEPSISDTGVYGIVLDNFEEGAISISVFDPFGSQIISKPVDRESMEERFDIVSSGSYKILIENSGMEETLIVAAIGHMPDNSTLSVGITGFYLLIVGLIGIVGIGIYAIRNRRTRKT